MSKRESSLARVGRLRSGTFSELHEGIRSGPALRRLCLRCFEECSGRADFAGDRVRTRRPASCGSVDMQAIVSAIYARAGHELHSCFPLNSYFRIFRQRLQAWFQPKAVAFVPALARQLCRLVHADYVRIRKSLRFDGVDMQAVVSAIYAHAGHVLRPFRRILYSGTLGTRGLK